MLYAYNHQKEEDRGKTKMIGKLWRWLRAPHPRYAVGFVIVIAGIGGIVFWGGFHTVLELTNTEAFCISCHEMRDTVYKEYTTSLPVHYKNASGVRASCPDCHVPKQWGPKIVRKIAASNELYHWALGTIATPEKFEANRLAMARRVWASMTETDSRECRNCHSKEAIDFHKMKKPEEAKRMEKGLKDGETCISCHKGIAHKMPDMSQGYRGMLKDIAATAGKQINKGDLVQSWRTSALFVDAGAASAEANGEGKLLAATATKVIDVKGDWVHLTIAGWQQEGAERVIFALKGQRILSAALAPELIDKIRREESAEDPDTGLVWARVAVDAWVARDSLVKDPGALWAYGKEMYASTCSSCHGLHPEDHMLANQVIGTLDAMKHFLPLDDEEYRFLLKYLQFHAQDTKGMPHG
jgi:trimethylamine-N-oxide reductase cytochrome c-type subunit TorC